MRVRMITSLGARDYDLPYGTQLVVGEVMDPKRGRLDEKTAERWLRDGVVEKAPEEEPPPGLVIETSVIERAETAAVSRPRGRKPKP